MRLLGQILFVCLVLAALQGLVAVLVIAIVLLLIFGILFKTRETVGLLIFGLLLTVLQVHPWVTIGAGIVLTCALLIGKKVEIDPDAPPSPRLLPPPEHTDSD